jgi:predicted RNase H-like nuclease (RuvC/YqgF family)
MMTINRSILLAILTFGIAAVLSADAECGYKTREPNAAEKKAYADAFALFQRMAPPAPAGWESIDSVKDNVLRGNDVCTAPGEIMTSFTFMRSYNHTEGMAERNAEVMKKTEARVQKSQDQQKANEAKLAEISKKIEDLSKKVGDLAAANKINEIAPISAEIQKLQDEQQKLMGYGESDAESKEIEAIARKDSYAQFSLTVDAEISLSNAFKPMSVSEGKGYRQDYDDDNGIAHSDIVLILEGSGVSRILYRRLPAGTFFLATLASWRFTRTSTPPSDPPSSSFSPEYNSPARPQTPAPTRSLQI